MEFPICISCAASGVLCKACEEKLRGGRIGDLDVLVSSILKRRGVFGYYRLVLADGGKKVVILTDDVEAKKAIGPGGKSAAELSKKIGRRVAVVSLQWDADLMIKSVARPARLLAKNKVFKEGGEETLKLIFDKALDEDSISLLKELIGDFELSYQKRDLKR